MRKCHRGTFRQHFASFDRVLCIPYSAHDFAHENYVGFASNTSAPIRYRMRSDTTRERGSVAALLSVNGRSAKKRARRELEHACV